MRINRSTEFKRAYNERIRKNPKLKKLFWEKVEEFQANPFDPSLKTHPLTGLLQGRWAFSVDYDCRIVFLLVSDNEVVFLNVGTHAEVYK